MEDNKRIAKEILEMMREQLVAIPLVDKCNEDYDNGFFVATTFVLDGNKPISFNGKKFMVIGWHEKDLNLASGLDFYNYFIKLNLNLSNASTIITANGQGNLGEGGRLEFPLAGLNVIGNVDPVTGDVVEVVGAGQSLIPTDDDPLHPGWKFAFPPFYNIANPNTTEFSKCFLMPKEYWSSLWALAATSFPNLNSQLGAGTKIILIWRPDGK